MCGVRQSQAELVHRIRGAEEELVPRLCGQRHPVGNPLEAVPQHPVRDPKLVHRKAAIRMSPPREKDVRESDFILFYFKI